MPRSQLDIIINLVEKGSKRGLDGIVKSISAMAVALGAVKVAGDAWRAGMEGAQLNKIAKAASSLAKSVGQDMGKIVEEIQRVSDGAISAADAMTYASKAIKLGVADTPEEIGRLVKAATQLGTALGDNVSHSVESLIIGIGRMSPLVLDNLGIMVQGGKVFDDYAASIGKAKDELTDAEKKQALLNQAITDANKIGEVQATGFEQMDAALKDLGDVIKMSLVPILEPLARAIGDAARRTLELKENTELLTRAGFEQWQLDRLTGEEKAKLALAIQTESARYQGLADRITGAQTAAENAIPAIEASIQVGAGQQAGAIPAFNEIIRKLTSIQNKALLAAQAQKEVIFGPGGPPVRGMLESKLTGGPGFAAGANFVVPPGFPADSFPFRASSGERVIVQPASGGQSFFDNSTVNINNGTSMDAFESMLRGLA